MVRTGRYEKRYFVKWLGNFFIKKTFVILRKKNKLLSIFLINIKYI